MSNGEQFLQDALLNASKLVDLIVVARGGGSVEDLSTFNSERVARAIVASAVPVVSAIGHETDFTIADFVADLRAPTPSAAAELITEAQHRVGDRVAAQSSRLERAARFQLLHARQKIERVPMARAERRVTTMLYRLDQRLDDMGFRMEASVTGLVRARQREVAELAADVLHHEPRQMLVRTRERLRVSHTRMERSLERTLRRSTARLEALDAQLRSLSPLGVLERGYALVVGADGGVIRSSAQIAKGDRVRTRLSDGEFASTVDEVGQNRKRTN